MAPRPSQSANGNDCTVVTVMNDYSDHGRAKYCKRASNYLALLPAWGSSAQHSVKSRASRFAFRPSSLEDRCPGPESALLSAAARRNADIPARQVKCTSRPICKSALARGEDGPAFLLSNNCISRLDPFAGTSSDELISTIGKFYTIVVQLRWKCTYSATIAQDRHDLH
jgi:hypothetical protein